MYRFYLRNHDNFSINFILLIHLFVKTDRTKVNAMFFYSVSNRVFNVALTEVFCNLHVLGSILMYQCVFRLSHFILT